MEVYIVELVEFLEDWQVAYVASSLDGAQAWMREHGRDYGAFTGDEQMETVFYNISSQEVDNDDFEIFTNYGRFDTNGVEIDW